MNLATEPNTAPLPSIFEHFPRVATQPKHATKLRKTLFLAGLAVVPAAVGVLFGRSSWPRGVIAGGVAACALGALRLQLARWFTETPAYESEGAVGELEIRRYPTRIEALTDVEASELEDALDTGYDRLACFIYGKNMANDDIEMSAPVVTTMRDGRYAISFVMPPGRDIGSLPRPDDTRIELHEVGEKRIAALCFHGRFTHDNIARHEKKLLRQLVDAGLSARGSVMFAAYDSPLTLPFLRRNELWIEIV